MNDSQKNFVHALILSTMIISGIAIHLIFRHPWIPITLIILATIMFLRRLYKIIGG